MRRLLVSVDGSANALRALHYAISLVRDEAPAEVYLAMGEESVGAAVPAVDPAAKALARAGVSIHTEILNGDVAPTIVRRAEELACDAIVMVTRGTRTDDDIGTVARRVVQLSKLPVALIH